MDRLSGEFPLDDHIGFLEPFFNVSQFVLDVAGDVALGPGVIALGETFQFEISGQVVVEQRRVFFHSFFKAKDWFQDLVIDFDRLQS